MKRKKETNGKKKLKGLIFTMIMMSLLYIAPLQADAATAGSWNIDYKKGAPTSVSNQVSVVRVSYYSGGYESVCSSLTGTSGRYITITSSSAGGMTTQKFTSSNTAKTWKMKSSTTSDVIFNVTAKTTGYCKSRGSIYLK